jgi:hypothetical protein
MAIASWYAGSGLTPGGASEIPSWAGSSPGSQGAGAYGAIPQLPAYTKDISTQVGPDVYAQLTRNLPGYQQMVGASSGNIGANLAGQLSPDVIAQMQQAGAERGIATGTEGSGANNAAYLRALGLNSMQLQQLGESQLTAAVGRTPIQQTQTGTQATDLAAQQAIYNAAPNPAMATQAALSAAMGGMGAGRGGGPSPIAPLAPISGMGYGGYQSPYSYYGSPEPAPFDANSLLAGTGLTYGQTPYTGGQLGDEYAGSPMEGSIQDPYSDWWS